MNSTLAEPVSPAEKLARYLLDKSKFASTKSRVKANAFAPPPDGDVSVYRIDALSETEIWEIGQAFVAAVLDKPLRARADLSASDVFQAGLLVEAAPNPHPRHANITDWPPSKDKQLQIAAELAEASILVLPPV